jgi:hypothetical protein
MQETAPAPVVTGLPHEDAKTVAVRLKQKSASGTCLSKRRILSLLRLKMLLVEPPLWLTLLNLAFR